MKAPFLPGFGIAALCCALLSPTAAGQSPFDLDTLQPGEVLLNLSAQEQREVEQDILVAVLRYIAQGPDPTALQNEVNTAIDEALSVLGESETIRYSTEQYFVYPYRGRPAREEDDTPLWRAQQSLRLSSEDSGELLEYAGRLQNAGLQMGALNYTLSPEKEEDVMNSLLESALGKLQAKADQAAGALGKSSAALIEVNIEDSPNFGIRRDAAVAMAAESEAFQPPSASPGVSRVTLRVSAKARLSP